MTDRKPVWRKHLIVNGPTATSGKKANLLPLPERFDVMAEEVLRRGVDAFGICEASTKTWQRLHDHHGFGGHRGLANDMWSPTNALGNHNYWDREAYRSQGRRNIHTDAGPNERGLNMPLTLLEDRESLARHAKLLVHNYAKPHASAAARRQVRELILDVVSTLHAAGILVDLSGDLNDDNLPGASKAGLKHVGNVDVTHQYVSKQIDVRAARPLVKGWGGRITDHKGAFVSSLLIPISRTRVSLPRDL